MMMWLDFHENLRVCKETNTTLQEIMTLGVLGCDHRTDFFSSPNGSKVISTNVSAALSSWWR